MRVSTSWIKEWLRRTMSDTQIVEALERAGLEIEQYNASKPIDENIVVGLVKNVIQHPNAERLKLVQVDIGGREVRVVCGASNVRPGIKAPLAQVGVRLLSGDMIQAAKLRGEVSEGMLCSELELGLGKDHSGILELNDDVAVGTSLCDIYTVDGIVDLKTHANRFDLLSVVGLAREVAAMTDTSLRGLPANLAPAGQGPELAANLPVARFMLARLAVKSSPPSPDWMVARLRSAGVRSIGAIVDVTNYVNLEFGQPLHAYDAAKVTLPLTVRQAKDGERLKTLDGVERKLTHLDLVVADAKGPVGLAGLMGGADTEVDETTEEILLEAAIFDGATVRKMAKRQGLRTEASARFERGLPVDVSPVAMVRAVGLLGDVAEAKVLGVSDQLNKPAEVRAVAVDHEFMERLLGFEATPREIVAALGRLQIDATATKDGKQINVAALPWWRTDLREGQDLIEETVRVLGYDRVPSIVPVWRPQVVEFDQKRPRQRLLRQVLYGAGLFDVMTYSFVGEGPLTELGLKPRDHLKLKNPMTAEQAYLRSSLLASHLQVLARNRGYAKELGFYELSKVFVKQGRGDQPDEPLHLGVMMVRPEEAYRHLKGVLDAVGRELQLALVVESGNNLGPYLPSRAALVLLDGQSIGTIGQLDTELLRAHKIAGEAAYMELDADRMLAAAKPARFAGLQRFPSGQRDLAVIVAADVTWRAVSEALADMAGVHVEFVSDYYGGDVPAGHKSLALRLTISHPDRTPTDAEAMDAEQKALAVLKRKFGARLRD